ncbi:MAG TPA: OmpH family outer membrane protein [Candidatus Pelagibacter bacterium]|jgi:outer membrane protein|nr:OmpH family outer membrane protein [Candidatus Pelagibacter bacterium]|tara:strand:+ start:1476 stop:2006 length:531 start_codon:yes stop_codon:yes gene_type:complete
MKYHVRFFVIILITFCFTVVKANESTSVVYIDMDIVMKKSIAGKSLIEHVNKIHISNINEFKKIEESIKSEESSIMSQKNILSEEEFSKKINSLKKKINDYKKNRKIKIDFVSKKKAEATTKFFEILNPILADYSKKKNISIILRKKTIIIAKSDLDITNKIIELMNLKIKKINLN